MPRIKVSLKERASEFAKHGLYEARLPSRLMCKYCDVRLEHEKKNTLDKHVSSARHVEGKARFLRSGASTSRQQTIAESNSTAQSARDEKQAFILETLDAFLNANISVEALDKPKMRAWINKHVKGSGDLPGASWCRQNYIPLLKTQKEDEIRSTLVGKQVAVLCDETTDAGGRCVFNVLFKVLDASSNPDVILAASIVLDAANGQNCANSIINTLQRYNVPFENVIAIVSDSARYMSTCFNTLSGLMDPLIQIQCWAHKLNLVGSIWAENLEILNTAVTRIKNAFLNTRKRKNHYLEFLRSKYGDESEMATLFPMPVQTRWNSWFKSVAYISKHVDDLVEFFRSCDDGNMGINYFKECSQSDIVEIKIQATFVGQTCPTLVDLLTFLEGTKYPSAHVLVDKLDDLDTKLSMWGGGAFPQDVDMLLRKLSTLQRAQSTATLKSTVQKSLTKLRSLVAADPAKAVFKGINMLLSPRRLVVSSLGQAELKNIQRTMPFMNELAECTFLEGYAVLRKTVRDQLGSITSATNSVDIKEVLCVLAQDLPDFATSALKAMWIPTNNVDSERSFSKYSFVVNDRRRRLKPENAETLTMLAFE